MDEFDTGFQPVMRHSPEQAMEIMQRLHTIDAQARGLIEASVGGVGRNIADYLSAVEGRIARDLNAGHQRVVRVVNRIEKKIAAHHDGRLSVLYAKASPYGVIQPTQDQLRAWALQTYAPPQPSNSPPSQPHTITERNAPDDPIAFDPPLSVGSSGSSDSVRSIPVQSGTAAAQHSQSAPVTGVNPVQAFALDKTGPVTSAGNTAGNPPAATFGQTPPSLVSGNAGGFNPGATVGPVVPGLPLPAMQPPVIGGSTGDTLLGGIGNDFGEPPHPEWIPPQPVFIPPPPEPGIVGAGLPPAPPQIPPPGGNFGVIQNDQGGQCPVNVTCPECPAPLIVVQPAPVTVLTNTTTLPRPGGTVGPTPINACPGYPVWICNLPDLSKLPQSGGVDYDCLCPILSLDFPGEYLSALNGMGIDTRKLIPSADAILRSAKSGKPGEDGYTPKSIDLSSLGGQSYAALGGENIGFSGKPKE